jgi:hypothetical protein
MPCACGFEHAQQPLVPFIILASLRTRPPPLDDFYKGPEELMGSPRSQDARLGLEGLLARHLPLGTFEDPPRPGPDGVTPTILQIPRSCTRLSTRDARATSTWPEANVTVCGWWKSALWAPPQIPTLPVASLSRCNYPQ